MHPNPPIWALGSSLHISYYCIFPKRKSFDGFFSTPGLHPMNAQGKKVFRCNNEVFASDPCSSFGPIVSLDAQWSHFELVHSVIIESRQTRCLIWRVIQAVA